jgi:hypothetical protein
VTGARPPAGAPSRDLAAAGYTCEEFLLEGTTVAYRHGELAGSYTGGRWEAEEYGEADYRTRILVVRPTRDDAFNGTVLLNWQNVSAGFELGSASDDEFYRGYAWVGVSAQEIGLYGSPWGAGVRGRSAGRGLIDTDPDRYGELSHPGDAGSFEIFGQAALAVGTQRAGEGSDPLGGLAVRRVVALGGSQSAMRLVSYFNGVHARHRTIDGAVLTVWEGRAPRLDDGPVSTGRRTVLRDDLDVPVVIVNSEFEATVDAGVGLDDRDRLRIWEVTGTPHGNRRRVLPPSESGWQANPLSHAPVQRAAIRGMHDWLAAGRPVPSQPRIARSGDGTGPLLRDELGNAVGGIRLPELAAPIGAYRGMSQRTGQPALFGGYQAFTAQIVADLYGGPEGYLDRWDTAVTALVADGALLQVDAEEYRARGRGVADELPAAPRPEPAS